MTRGIAAEPARAGAWGVHRAADEGPLRVVYFAADREEASQVRLARAIFARGAELTVLGFRRDNSHEAGPSDWTVVDLGDIRHGIGAARLWGLFCGTVRALGALPALRRADVIVARNLDMALMALALRSLAFGRGRVVYQLLDVHSVMTEPGLTGRIARWCERWVLGSAAVVVSAPDFLTEYLRPRQGYAGPARLMENRIVWTGPPPPRPHPSAPAEGPLRLGWVGSLRCPATLDLLLEVADRLGARCELVLRGNVHRHQLPGFDAALRGRANVRYEGPYSYPDGLAWAYGGLDAVWAQDLWQRGGNSDWLLPNRLYEAGYFGCPTLAVAGTATARRVAETGAGIVVDAATPEAVIAALEHHGGHLAALRDGLLARPDQDYQQDPSEIDALLSY